MHRSAPLPRRLLSLLYETLLLAAFLWAAALVYTLVEHRLAPLHDRLVFQYYLFGVSGVYFVWQWTRGGQTLAMKSWRLRLATRDGGRVTLLRASVRYAYASLGTAFFAVTYVWALVDRERHFLHDRLAGTRIIGVPATTSSTRRGREKPASA